MVCDPSADSAQVIEINPSGCTERVEGVNQVLGREVSGGTRTERTAAEATDRGVKGTDAMLESDEHVQQGLAVGVVEVESKILVTDAGRSEIFEQGSRLWCSTRAGSICDRDLVGAHFQQGGGKICDGGGRDIGAFKRASEGDRNVGTDGEIPVPSLLHERTKTIDRFCDRAVCVLLGEGLCCSEEDGDLVLRRVR